MEIQKEWFDFQNKQYNILFTVVGAHLTPYFIQTGVILSGVKRPGDTADNSPLPVAE